MSESIYPTDRQVWLLSNFIRYLSGYIFTEENVKDEEFVALTELEKRIYGENRNYGFTLAQQRAREAVIRVILTSPQAHLSIVDGSEKRLIAVDFDQTLCKSGTWPKLGPPIPGGREALLRFRELGYLILIYTCRTCHWHYNIFGGSRDIPTLERAHVVAMSAWLIENDIPFDEIDDGSRGKPYADFYIDDKAVRFENNWPEIVALVTQSTKIEVSR